MRIELGFGDSPQAVDIPDANLTRVLRPNNVRAGRRGVALVEEALQRPVGTRKLSEILHRGESVAIITSDITRPVPGWAILPAVLEELWRAGIAPEDVTVVFALGSHRSQTIEEHKRLVGEAVWNKVRCVDSDPRDCIRMGVTARGTPVDITRVVAQADRRIGIGNIEYHYFAGYSGGNKAVMPGVSTRAAIQSNHSHMVLPESETGRLDGNPVREDIEEAARYCPLDFIVNVVLDEHKEIIYAVAGHSITAHRAGCRFLDTLYRIELPSRADIVIASQGGSPKDLNLYQTQKALDNARYAVRDGGVIILLGSCKEGMGEEIFEAWMREANHPRDLIARIKRDFQLGGHKAAAIAMVLEKAEIYLVSEMPPDFVRSIFLQPYGNARQALDAAFQKLGHNATVAVMPCAGSTLPSVL
jgi:nickel-dependent lactate racemase